MEGNGRPKTALKSHIWHANTNGRCCRPIESSHTYTEIDHLHLHVCADDQSAQAVCTRQRPKLILRHDDEQPGEFSSLSMINCRFINGRSDESLLARWACMILQTLHLSADIISADVGKLPDDDATRWWISCLSCPWMDRHNLQEFGHL